MIRLETRIGKVRSVDGQKIIVAMEPGSEVAPVIHGRLHKITQIGSILKIRIGANYAIGHVVSATAASLAQTALTETNQSFGWSIAPGEKALIVNLFGEIRSGEFERGLTTFPDIDSEVHVITLEDLKTIYSANKNFGIPAIFGEISGGVSLPAILDMQKLVVRHAAIVGATGTGKSNAVSTILREINDEKKWPGAKVIIIDIHGEYSSWLKEKAKVFSIGGAKPLVLPYWLVPFDELLTFFMGRQITQEDLGTRNLKEAIIQGKIDWLNANGMSDIVSSVTVDSPVPFDLRKIWYDLYVDEHATYSDKNQIPANIAWKHQGDASNFVPPVFTPPGAGSAPPFKKSGPTLGVASILEKIRTRCIDKNYAFLFGTNTNTLLDFKLNEMIKEWMQAPATTVLDLNGVPSDIVDITVGTISRLFFDLWRWGRDQKGVGRDRPIYLVYDEAHLYLSDAKYGFTTGSSIRTVTRVLREGRKYGIGALIVSQRPSDINTTIFSQIGTIISLRLNNASDLGIVKSSLQDNLSNISEIIPALRTGEALVSGQATALPLRVRFFEIKGREHGSDAKLLGAWDKQATYEGLEEAIKKWRSNGQ